jgi:hypothetical protein
MTTYRQRTRAEKMATRKSIAALALTLLATQAHAAPSCTITACRGGGIADQCYTAIAKQARAMRKAGCGQIQVASGVSSYAMATTVGNCIVAGSVIKVHKPYTLVKGQYAAQEQGSKWHTYYFSRLTPQLRNAFYASAGNSRKGWMNAFFMTAISANKTGMRICK